jgi:hypothetical protein
VGGSDYSYIGRSYSGNNDPSDPRLRPSYRLLNARIAFDRGGFEIALVGKNLANEVANLGDSRSIADETPGRPRLFVNQPCTLGLEFRQSFRGLQLLRGRSVMSSPTSIIYISRRMRSPMWGVQANGGDFLDEKSWWQRT